MGFFFCFQLVLPRIQLNNSNKNIYFIGWIIVLIEKVQNKILSENQNTVLLWSGYFTQYTCLKMDF